MAVSGRAMINLAFQSTQPEWAATKVITAYRLVIGVFQSTQPEWAATAGPIISFIIAKRYFNPRSPSGLRPQVTANYLQSAGISIHAARVGCDAVSQGDDTFAETFQSTQPEWAATFTENFTRIGRCGISIHAARVGCDNRRRQHWTTAVDFNPRSPSGLRQKDTAFNGTGCYFNPRSPSGLRLYTSLSL